MILMTFSMVMSLPNSMDSSYFNSNVILCTTLHFSLRSMIFSPLLILLGKHVYLKSNSTLLRTSENRLLRTSENRLAYAMLGAQPGDDKAVQLRYDEDMDHFETAIPAD